MHKPLTLIFIGRPGSGKSTQIQKIRKEFNCKVIGTGALMRELAKHESFIGRKLKSVLDAGGLPPEWLAVYLWINELLKVGAEENIILDGSPRRLMEAKKMDSVLRWLGRNDVKAFLIDITEEESINRITKRRICGKCGVPVIYSLTNKELVACEKCGGELINRGDDDMDDIKAKFTWYRKNVEKVIRHYKTIGKLVRINGEQGVDEVHREVVAYLRN